MIITVSFDVSMEC